MQLDISLFDYFILICIKSKDEINFIDNVHVTKLP